MKSEGCSRAAEIPAPVLAKIVTEAFNFPVPLVTLNERLHILELFHGPTLAFKDFGARFMARLMGYFVQESGKHLTVIVATSGDTGSAVAQAFLGVPGIRVVILYPAGRVSIAQEKQLTTLGQNITALEVSGSFDDCQRLAKQALVDPVLAEKLTLTSANSINIGRLIPQIFYYFPAVSQLKSAGNSGGFFRAQRELRQPDGRAVCQAHRSARRRNLSPRQTLTMCFRNFFAAAT